MSAMSPPVLRVAGPRDSGDLLAWRNDPETRANSRNTDTIARDSHEAWLERVLADPDRRIWVAEADGRKLGTVSAARTGPDTVEVSITVAPGLRGSGVGGAMLRGLRRRDGTDLAGPRDRRRRARRERRQPPPVRALRLRGGG